MQQHIERAEQAARLQKYWIKKKRHTNEQDNLTDCESLGQARKKENKGFNVAMTKLYSGNFGCNAKLHKWNMRGDDKCPQCGKNGKDLNHIVTCNHKEVKEERKKEINNLAKDMHKLFTSQPIQRAIVESLRHWLIERRWNGQWVSSIAIINEAIKEQRKIGWHNFLMVMWSKK